MVSISKAQLGLVDWSNCPGAQSGQMQLQNEEKCELAFVVAFQ